MRRREFIAGLGSAAALPLGSQADDHRRGAAGNRAVTVLKCAILATARQSSAARRRFLGASVVPIIDRAKHGRLERISGI
jgi:hypothetical protein